MKNIYLHSNLRLIALAARLGRPSESVAVTSGNVMLKTLPQQALLWSISLSRIREYDKNVQSISHCFYVYCVIALPSIVASLSLGLEGMRRAGFRRVFLGIETPVEASLKEAQKGQNTRRDLLESVQKIQSHGLEVMAGFIVGFDNDPEDIFERQVKFIRESAIPLAMVGLLGALPDTQLWRRLEREGRLLGETTGNNTDCSLSFVPKMNAERLVEGYKTILRTIYSSKAYYQRALDSLQRVEQHMPEPRRGSLASELAALARVMLSLGVRDRERGAFWRYRRAVTSSHRDKFPQAVMLAALGYHCRKMTEVYCGPPQEAETPTISRGVSSIRQHLARRGHPWWPAPLRIPQGRDHLSPHQERNDRAVRPA